MSKMTGAVIYSGEISRSRARGGFTALFCLFLAWTAGFAEQLRFEILQAGDAVYRDVRVREVSPKWILIVHAEGISQVPLRELSPELQERFGYDRALEREFEEGLRRERETVRRPPDAIVPPQAIPPPLIEVRDRVDLRPRFIDFGLHARDQGRHPSCVIFAFLGILEFQFSLRHGEPVPLSEEFLLWATRQVNPDQDDPDGYSFLDVFHAIRQYGVARRDLMRDSIGLPARDIEPGPLALADAAGRRNVSASVLAGSAEAKIERIVHELNAGVPVVVSLRWPPDHVVARVHTLRKQEPKPDGGHAVAIVGYEQEGGRAVENLLFLFRNSYGPRWGSGGYGYIAYSYLREHLFDVLIFEAPAEAAAIGP